MSQNTGPTGPSNPTPPATGATVTINPNTVTSGGNVIIGGTVAVAPIHIQWISSTHGVWGYMEAIQTQPVHTKKDDRDGCDCAKCGDFYPYAEPNQDAGTLICYRCRMGW